MTNDMYDSEFYQLKRDGSRDSASVVVPLIMGYLSPQSVVDVGCGTGSWLASFQQAGVKDITGIEFSDIDLDLADIEHSKIQRIDVSKPFSLNREFDLVMSVEVAEHLPPESASDFIQSLTRLGRVVLFSAAIPGQGGLNHLNEQWPSYWVRHFEENGFTAVDCIRDEIWWDSRVEWWYRQNLLFFVRNDSVHRYPKLVRKHRSIYQAALDRSMPHRLRIGRDETQRKSDGSMEAPSLNGLTPSSPGPITTSAVIITKNGAERIAYCLESIVRSGFADEIVVCVDQSTTDDTVEIVKRFTSNIHMIKVERVGNMEGLLRHMASLCSGNLILRVDDDECLGGDWDRNRILSMARFNDITHFLIPRRWLVPPGDRFISSSPWFPDLQLRLYINDPALVTWPEKLHETMTVSGRGVTLTDCWVDHYDLVINGRPSREQKCQIYQKLRPEKHLSNFYLYEEEETDFLPADETGFLEALANVTLAQTTSTAAGLYELGAEVRFDVGGNGDKYRIKGWSNPETWGTWTDGTSATLCFSLETPIQGAAMLAIEICAFLAPGHPACNILVFCEGESIGEWSIKDAGLMTMSLAIPASAIALRKKLHLEFRIANPRSPAECGMSEDKRMLGLGLSRLSIVPIEE